MNSGRADPAMVPFDRVLVTGSDGFVGRHLIARLRDRLPSSARITGTSRRERLDRVMDVLAMDIRSADSVAAVVETVRPDLVIHLAAQSSGASDQTSVETWGTNVLGSFNLAQSIAALPDTPTVLFASSAEVYGSAFATGPVTEMTPPQPSSVYGRSKFAAEALLSDVLSPDGRLIVARPGNHSGPGQDERFVLTSFAAQIARIERGLMSEMQVGNLAAERDFLDVRDVVDAYIDLLASAPRLPNRTIFNVASGRLMRVGALLEMMAAASSVPIMWHIDDGRLRQGEVKRAPLDASHLFATTGWTPQMTVDQTVADILDGQRSRLGE